jgi:hypothetical protein
MSRTNYIFLDFENVQEADWGRIAGRPVKVIVVYGQEKRYLEIRAIEALVRCASQVEMVESKKTGRNAADMLIAERIGEIKAVDPHGFFHIISKDKGFDSLVENLRVRGTLAARRTSFAEVPVLMNLEERITCFAVFLRTNPKNRPGKLSALHSQIQVNFGRALAAEEVDQIVNGLKRREVLRIDDKGKVSYAK